jgi:hypothetical protein
MTRHWGGGQGQKVEADRGASGCQAARALDLEHRQDAAAPRQAVNLVFGMSAERRGRARGALVAPPRAPRGHGEPLRARAWR